MDNDVRCGEIRLSLNGLLRFSSAPVCGERLSRGVALSYFSNTYEGREMEKKRLVEIVQRQEGKLGGLVAILEEIQERCGYLPEDAMREVSERTGHPLLEIYGVATFYKFFRLQPRGKHLVLVCLGTACHVRGAPKVSEEFERQLGINSGETTADMEFTMETVNCVGACALGPVVIIDGHYFPRVSINKVKGIIRKARAGLGRATPHKVPKEA